MANYKYDRYSVGSYVDYLWSRYKAEPYYAYPDFDNSVSMGTPSSYTGYTTVFFNTATGQFTNSPTRLTIHPGSGSSVGEASGTTAYRYQFDSRAGYNELWRKSTTSYFDRYERGDLVLSFYGTYSAYTNNARNSDGYWYVRGNSYTNYYRGSYIDTIVAEDGTYPADGRSGSYWYVRRDRAFPDLAVKVNSQLGTSIDGWVKVSGQSRQIVSITVKVDGQLKEI